MQKLLITIGIVLLVAGIAWPYLSKIPLFRLPGDIVIDKPNFKMFIPVTSMLLISIVLSLIVWIVKKFF